MVSVFPAFLSSSAPPPSTILLRVADVYTLQHPAHLPCIFFSHAPIAHIAERMPRVALLSSHLHAPFLGRVCRRTPTPSITAGGYRYRCVGIRCRCSQRLVRVEYVALCASGARGVANHPGVCYAPAAPRRLNTTPASYT
jgi:hypothetical protein